MKAPVVDFAIAARPSAVDATTKCHGWEFTEEGLFCSTLSSVSICSCGSVLPPSKALTVWRASTASSKVIVFLRQENEINTGLAAPSGWSRINTNVTR
jgi:hypothetical protein